MGLPADFIQRLEVVLTREVVELFDGPDRLQVGTSWKLNNELRPADLYCYFGARYGAPNGIQSVILRADSSDNLIHWDWFLKYSDEVYLNIQGLSFRTEVWIFGLKAEDSECSGFIQQLKAEFAQHGAEMGKIRRALEHWIEFVNPYQRLRRAVTELNNELSSLDRDSSRRPIPDLADEKSPAEIEQA